MGGHVPTPRPPCCSTPSPNVRMYLSSVGNISISTFTYALPTFTYYTTHTETDEIDVLSSSRYRDPQPHHSGHSALAAVLNNITRTALPASHPHHLHTEQDDDDSEGEEPNSDPASFDMSSLPKQSVRCPRGRQEGDVYPAAGDAHCREYVRCGEGRVEVTFTCPEHQLYNDREGGAGVAKRIGGGDCSPPSRLNIDYVAKCKRGVVAATFNDKKKGVNKQHLLKTHHLHHPHPKQRGKTNAARKQDKKRPL